MKQEHYHHPSFKICGLFSPCCVILSSGHLGNSTGLKPIQSILKQLQGFLFLSRPEVQLCLMPSQFLGYDESEMELTSVCL